MPGRFRPRSSDTSGGALPAARLVCDRLSAGTLAILAGAVGCLTYWLVTPSSPDLASQVARASAVGRGAGAWWNGWYGGVTTAPYSLLTAPLMRTAGVATVGIAATAVSVLMAARLATGCRRPRAAALTATAAAMANLFSGRVTFAVGGALALTALQSIRSRRWGTAVLAASLSGPASPLAALFLAVAAAGSAVTSRAVRRLSIAVVIAAAIPVLVVNAAFGQPSAMPFDRLQLGLTLLTAGVVAAAPVPSHVRVTAALLAVVAVVAFLVPTAVGSNAARLALLPAVPVLVGTARWSRPGLLLVVLPLSAWPLLGLVDDLRPATDPSANAEYYSPLLAQLPTAGTATQRLEVVDPRSHGADAYLPARVPLARGWERQIDAANNPLFYRGRLNAASYRLWLSARAVGWVAVPDAALDYAAVAEARLIGQNLRYLRLRWRGAHWTLYRVTDPNPLATGAATVTGLTDDAILLRASRAGRVELRTPFTRSLVALDAAGNPTGCLSAGPAGTTVLRAPAAGRYRIQGQWFTDRPQC